MFKVVKIDGKQIPMKSSGLTGRLYAREFNRDWLSDIVRLQNLGKGDIDTSIVDKMAFVLAKTANNKIEPFDEWLDTFDTPTSIFMAFGAMQDLLFSSLKTTTRKKKGK